MFKGFHGITNFLLIVVGAVSMAFAVTVFALSTYILLLPILNLFVPAVADSLPYAMDRLTDWTGINFLREGELFATLSVRFILLGMVVLTLVFLVRPPTKMIRQAIAGRYKTSKVISLKWYFRAFIGLFLFSFICGFLATGANEGGTNSAGLIYALGISSSVTAILLVGHCFLLFFLLGFWNLGCELIYPLLLKR